MNLGEFIQARRKRMFLTQEQLAEKMMVSKSAIAKWETNGGIPDRDNLYKLAEVTGVSVNELHRIIVNSSTGGEDFMINITPDVIAILESRGYKVIPPEAEKRRHEDVD